MLVSDVADDAEQVFQGTFIVEEEVIDERVMPYQILKACIGGESDVAVWVMPFEGMEYWGSQHEVANLHKVYNQNIHLGANYSA